MRLAAGLLVGLLEDKFSRNCSGYFLPPAPAGHWLSVLTATGDLHLLRVEAQEVGHAELPGHHVVTVCLQSDCWLETKYFSQGPSTVQHCPALSSTAQHCRPQERGGQMNARHLYWSLIGGDCEQIIGAEGFLLK